MTQVISEKKLQQLILADKNIAWLEKFELGGRSLLNRNSERAFRFSHYTIREFLIAYGILNEMIPCKHGILITYQMYLFLTQCTMTNDIVLEHIGGDLYVLSHNEYSNHIKLMLKDILEQKLIGR